MKCPIHNSELINSISNNQPLKQCRDCSGVWLNDGQLKQALGNGYKKYLMIFDLDLIKRGIVCPGCNHTLFEVEYKNIKIDICTECKGVWFDRGELQELCMKLNSMKSSDDFIPGDLVIGRNGHKSKKSQISADIAEFSIDTVLEGICWLFDL